MLGRLTYLSVRISLKTMTTHLHNIAVRSYLRESGRTVHTDPGGYPDVCKVKKIKL